jgi:hypothetical protein
MNKNVNTDVIEKSIENLIISVNKTNDNFSHFFNELINLHEVYVVGGFLRDVLFHFKYRDIDLEKFKLYFLLRINNFII